MDSFAENSPSSDPATESGLPIEKIFGRAYTVEEIRKVLGYSLSGFYRRMQKQPETLPRFIKVGASRYFLHSDVEAWAAETRKASTAS